MKLLHDNSSSLAARAFTTADADFDLVAVPRENLIASEDSTQFTEQDAMLEDHTPATVDHEHDVVLAPKTVDVFDQGLTFESLNSAVASVDAAGRVTRVADGETTIVVRAPRISRGVHVSVSREGGVTSRQFVGFVPGSLAAQCSAAVDSRLAGKSAASARAIYTTQNHGAGEYVRNVACWCGDIALTCLSPWNSDGGNCKAGTLVSPRHILFAEHYLIATGATIRFVTADNQVVTRTMVARQNVGPANSADSYASDLCVGLLDSDVPETIAFAKIVPANVEDYLPGLQYRVPCLCLDQEEKALVGDLYSLDGRVMFRSPTDAKRAEFHEAKISGDSGNPAFLLIDTGEGVEPVLVTTWTYGGAGQGPNVGNLNDEINAAMTALGGGYLLTPANLSGFPSYA
jgi:hypothetical protein